MHESHDNIISTVGVAILLNWPFWPLWPLCDTYEVKGHVTNVDMTTGHCDKVSLKLVYLFISDGHFKCWQKKEDTRQRCVIEMTHTLPLFWHFDPSFMWNNENRKSAQLGVKSVNIKFTGHEIQFDPGFIPLSCEWTKISAQLGVKSVNIKFIGHGIQFDPGFISLICEKVKIEKAPNWV